MPAPSLYLSKISAGGAEMRSACEELRKVIDDAGGAVDEIAEKLDMSRRSVFRLLDRADLVNYAYRARMRSGARDSRNGLPGNGSKVIGTATIRAAAARTAAVREEAAKRRLRRALAR
jgi:hypothetical protein